jgi:hypothetical protein
MYESMGVLTPVATYADTVGVAGTFVLAGSDMDIMSNPNWNSSCYVFSYEGLSTVSYGGQTDRLNMASELMSAIANSATTVEMLNGMFDNSGGYFGDASLNASSKQIKSKIAVGVENALSSGEKASVVALFDGWFADYATNVAPIVGTTTMAASGSAGMADNRELNAKGMEYDQIVAKSMIGALCLDQVVNGYLTATKLDVDNSDRSEGHTTMEHHWDEGFGYVYGKFGSENKFGDLSADGLLGKYLNKFNSSPNNYALTVYNAFKSGRAAIVAKDYVERDAQAAIINETLSLVVAAKAISYLEGAAGDVGDLSPDYFHGLSEGYGFILSLQFTNDGTGNAYFNTSQVNEMLATLEAGNGFWDRNASELTDMANTIRSASGL